MSEAEEETPAVETEVAYRAAGCEARVQRSPHVSEGLTVARLASVHGLAELRPRSLTLGRWCCAGVVTRNITLASRNINNPRNQIPCRLKVTLQQHVHVLADSRGIAIPSANPFRQRQRQRVHGCRDGDARAWVHG